MQYSVKCFKIARMESIPTMFPVFVTAKRRIAFSAMVAMATLAVSCTLIESTGRDITMMGTYRVMMATFSIHFPRHISFREYSNKLRIPLDK